MTPGLTYLQDRAVSKQASAAISPVGGHWKSPHAAANSETLAQLLRRHRVDDGVNKAIGKLIRVDHRRAGQLPTRAGDRREGGPTTHLTHQQPAGLSVGGEIRGHQ